MEKGDNRTKRNGAKAMKKYFMESGGVWKSELFHDSLEKVKVFPFPTLSIKRMLWKLTMYGKVFYFSTHLGKRDTLWKTLKVSHNVKAKAFPFPTIPTAITLQFFSLNVTFLKSKIR